MRRLSLFALLLVAGCATAPEQPIEQPVAPQPVRSAPVRNDLVGLSAAQLVQIFGTPALQIREGPGLKMQFRSRACVLDAFLYPSAGGERVTYVEARLPTGAATNPQSCYDTLKRG